MRSVMHGVVCGISISPPTHTYTPASRPYASRAGTRGFQMNRLEEPSVVPLRGQLVLRGQLGQVDTLAFTLERRKRNHSVKSAGV